MYVARGGDVGQSAWNAQVSLTLGMQPESGIDASAYTHTAGPLQG